MDEQSSDEIVAQAEALGGESWSKIMEGDYDNAIMLAWMALEMVTKVRGEMSFEACRFYYYLADALLSKIENSSEILNNGGTMGALTMDDIKKSANKLPEVLIESTNLIKEMFAQQAGVSVKHPEGTQDNNKTTKADDIGEIKPQEDKLDSTEAPIHPSETSAEPAEVKPDEDAIQPEPAGKAVEESLADNTPAESPAPVDECDKDNPRIQNEDDDEEEIIDTRPPHRKTSEEEYAENEEEKGDDNNEEEYATDEFKAPWENLEVALTIFNKFHLMSEDRDDFENKYWNLKADILERQADLEINRENTSVGIQLYRSLIDYCVKFGLDRSKSRSIAGILFKIGWAYNLDESGYQSAIDWFNEASQILRKLLYEDIKNTNPAALQEFQLSDFDDKEKLEKLEVASDKSKELKGILVEINNKIEEWSLSLTEKPLLDKEKDKEQEEKPNTFKKPMFEGQKPIELGSFGKGKKRSHEQLVSDTKASPEQEESSEKTEPTESIDKTSAKEQESHKRQKVEADN